MKKLALDRRTFLRGIGGTTVALPFLEAMGAKAAGPPHRYIVMYAGVSTGRQMEPTGLGAGYEPGVGLRPLADRGLIDDVNVISNMLVPWRSTSSAAEGETFDGTDHGNCHSPVLAGLSPNPDARSWGQVSICMGPTSDQIVASQIGSGTRFASLELKVQASLYGASRAGGFMSYRARDEPLSPIVNPQVAFDTLFTGFVPSNPGEVPARNAELERGRSVLDLVRGRTERLLQRVGAADRQRLDEHFTHIRAVEQRLANLPSTPTAACTVPTRPDRPTTGAEVSGGWSNETERGQVLSDLMTIALSCDLTRVATVMISHVQTKLGARSVGVTDTFHELSHQSSKRDKFIEGFAWHADQFAYLVERMKNTPDGDASLLDRSAVTLVPEHGWGRDSGDGDRDNAHSPEFFVLLQAGRAGNLRPGPGRHIDGNNAHPARVLVSAMRAVGVDDPLGVFDQGLPELSS